MYGVATFLRLLYQAHMKAPVSTRAWIRQMSGVRCAVDVNEEVLCGIRAPQAVLRRVHGVHGREPAELRVEKPVRRHSQIRVPCHVSL